MQGITDEQFSFEVATKTYSEGDSLTDDGRAFLVRAAATEKERSPRVCSEWQEQISP